VCALVVAIALALVPALPSPAAAKLEVGDGTGGVELRKLGEFDALGPSVPSPTSFGEGARGRIYVASHRGGVWKLK
jgi:hypothetical protein